MSRIRATNIIKLYLKIALFSPLLISNLWAVEAVGPINFSGGLSMASLATFILDQDSPDLANCSPEILGAMSKRNGSERFIKQSISSFPFTSVQRIYSSPRSSEVFKAIIGASKDKIIVSTSDTNRFWTVLSSNNAVGQHYNFVTMNGKVLIAGDALRENIKTYNISASTGNLLEAFKVNDSSNTINPRGKYQLVVNNYYLLANVQISSEFQHLPGLTTYYASGVLYSQLNNFSSMTIQRFINFSPDDGGEVTGIGSLTGGSTLVGGDFKTIVDVFKPSAIGELSFTVLDLPSQGGDYVFSEIAHGVGCIAPRTLTTTPRGYVFLDKGGVLVWNKTSFTNISGKIKPLIDDLIRTGKHKSAVMVYYPKKDWLILSIEHPQRFPKGANNYNLVFDFRTNEWWPFTNWLADSFTVADNAGDTGQLYYGDSVDGALHLADVETRPDDSRKETSIDVMDSSFTWSGSSQTIYDFIEGSAALKIAIYGIPLVEGQVNMTSMTRMGVFQFGEWNDKSAVSLNDKISFKAFAHNVTSISFLRIDFEVNDTTVTFDTNFTSVTISSTQFSGNRQWNTFEISLSSFPSRPDWTDLAIESVPFYSRFNDYGIRFVVGGVWLSSVIIDDLRLVQATENPIKMHRFTKLFDFQSPNYKSFSTMLLTRDKPAESSFKMDIYNDFGQVVRTEDSLADIPREILSFRFEDSTGFAILSSVDFSIKRQTMTILDHWNCLNGVMDGLQIVCGDRQNDRLLSFKRNDLSSFTAVYGSFGTGTSNFNLISEISQYPKGYFLTDLTNNRTKKHAYSNLSFIGTYGQLGTGATSYYDPTGAASDESYFYVADDSNNRFFKLNQSTFGIVLSRPTEHNTVADSSLAASDKALFAYFNRVDQVSDTDLEILLEKRDKGNLELIHRVKILPIGVSTGSYRSMGSIGLLGRYVFIAFSDEADDHSNTAYYIQKRLQSNLEVVSQYCSDKRLFSAIGNGKAYQPSVKTEVVDLTTEGRYIQLKFYDEDLDNRWTLYQVSPVLTVQPLTD